MTHPRKMMLEELERRNYAQTTNRLLHPDDRGFCTLLSPLSGSAHGRTHSRVPSVSVPREKAGRMVFLPEPDDLEKEFRSRSRLSSPSPKVWADVYLLAFASVAGLKFVSFGRTLKSHNADVLVL